MREGGCRKRQQKRAAQQRQTNHRSSGLKLRRAGATFDPLRLSLIGGMDVDPSAIMRITVGTFLLFLVSTPLAAQTPCPQSADSANTVVIHARARVAELQFTAAPRAGVTVTGCAAQPVEVTIRNNLPTPVQPNVVYRDVDIAIRIATNVRVLCSDVLRNALRGAQAATPIARLCESRQTPDTIPERTR